jgi:hypothetical protein
LMWHANMSMVPSWLIWITLTNVQHSATDPVKTSPKPLRMRSVIPRASPKSAEHSEFRVITAHAESLRKSTHFLHQYMSPFTMLPSVLFYKERLHIFMQHSSIPWRGSPFTSLPHHNLVRVGVNTSILILIVSIIL